MTDNSPRYSSKGDLTREMVDISTAAIRADTYVVKLKVGRGVDCRGSGDDGKKVGCDGDVDGGDGSGTSNGSGCCHGCDGSDGTGAM